MFAFTNKTLSLVIFLLKIMAFSFLFLFIFERERAEQVRGNTSGRGGPEGEGQVGSLSREPDVGCDSRRSLNLSSFLKFFFSFWLGWFLLPYLADHWSVLLQLFICCCFPLVYFSLQLLYSSALNGSSLYFLFLEVLTESIHSSPKFAEHLYDHYFELFIR